MKTYLKYLKQHLVLGKINLHENYVIPIFRFKSGNGNNQNVLIRCSNIFIIGKVIKDIISFFNFMFADVLYYFIASCLSSCHRDNNIRMT